MSEDVQAELEAEMATAEVMISQIAEAFANQVELVKADAEAQLTKAKIPLEQAKAVRELAEARKVLEEAKMLNVKTRLLFEKYIVVREVREQLEFDISQLRRYENWSARTRQRIMRDIRSLRGLLYKKPGNPEKKWQMAIEYAQTGSIPRRLAELKLPEKLRLADNYAVGRDGYIMNRHTLEDSALDRPCQPEDLGETAENAMHFLYEMRDGNLIPWSHPAVDFARLTITTIVEQMLEDVLALNETLRSYKKGVYELWRLPDILQESAPKQVSEAVASINQGAKKFEAVAGKS